MAIELDDLRTILEVLDGRPPGGRLLILGDALVHFQPSDLVAAAADAGFRLDDTPGSLDPFTLGRALGFAQTDTLDVNGNATLQLDLHEPAPAELRGAYDCIVDAGVLFWCSDPGAALRSILGMARVGGTIVHICAVSGFYGRGYYNVHPLLFEDFYLGNGCAFRAAGYRTRYVPKGARRFLARLRGTRNEVFRSDRPGNVYLASAERHRVGFAPRYRAPESELIPNNVLGVLAFEKTVETQISMPVRTEPYDEGERAS